MTSWNFCCFLCYSVFISVFLVFDWSDTKVLDFRVCTNFVIPNLIQFDVCHTFFKYISELGINWAIYFPLQFNVWTTLPVLLYILFSYGEISNTNRSAAQNNALPKMILKCILNIAILWQKNIFIINFISERKNIRN